MTFVPLEPALAAPDVALVQRIGEAAADAGVELWLVGGPVRDALLGRTVHDLDATSEMPAAELGAILAARLDGAISARSQFGTVKLRLGKRTIDLATTRKERYAKPGALPSVSPGDIRIDLARRDFSINAMALSLHPQRFGELLDTQGGAADIESRTLRALHERSFQDDATRLLRAVRYMARLAFQPEPETQRWLTRDLPYLGAISPVRLRREIELLLTEADAPNAIAVAIETGVLPAIERSLGAQSVREAVLRAGERKLHGLALLGALVYALPADRVAAFQARIRPTGEQKQIISAVARLREARSSLRTASLPSEVDRLAAGLPQDAIRAVAATDDDAAVQRNLDRYAVAAKQQMPLGGHELIALGVEPGPAVGEMARALRRAVMDGQATSREEAQAYVVGKLKEDSA